MSGSLASLDGEILPAAEAMIPATDEGLIRGDGVFEVIRVYDGTPFALEEHFARLERSAANLRLPIDLEAVRADAHRLLAEAGRGPGPRGAAHRPHPRRPAAAAHRAAARLRGADPRHRRHLRADPDPATA